MSLFFILTLLFLISPVSCAIISFMLFFKYKNNFRYQILCLIFISLFLGLINSLKVLEGDLINYSNFFNTVPEFNLLAYTLVTGKEIVFNLFNYIIYYLTVGNFSIYVIIFTLISYFLLSISILRMHKALKWSNNSLLLSIGVAFLFPTLFSLSAHLVRQFLAASLICVFLVEYIFYHKKKYLMTLAAVLIHTSSIFFIIGFIPFFKRTISLLNILKILLFLGLPLSIIFYFSNALISLFGSIPFLSYLINRAVVTDQYVQFNNLGIANFVILFFNVLITYIAAFSTKTSTKISLFPLFFINFFLMIFIIINFNNTEIALRFSFYAYFLIPFSCYFIMNFFSKINSLIIVLPILCILVALFIYNLYFGRWTYINTEKLFLLFI